MNEDTKRHPIDILFYDNGITISPLYEGEEPANPEQNPNNRNLFYENESKNE